MQAKPVETSAVDLSPVQSRKLVLLSQGIHSPKRSGQGSAALLRTIEQLGYIQIDTISVVERAHHHSLWNRVHRYQPSQLDALLECKQLFEYWSHAAAYLPMRDYRFSLPRKQAIAAGEKHWHVRDSKLNRLVLDRVRAEGPLQARDFEHKKVTGADGWWQWKPAKVALEQLFMEGELMIVRRKGFQKIYDLTERVLPAGIDTTTPSESEFQQHLIQSFLIANGIGTPAQIAYLRKGLAARIATRCRQMHADGRLLKVRTGQQDYYALPNIEELLAKPLSRRAVKILSPFDNLVIQRKRLLELFDFDYQIECYLPAARRRYGYFCLPLLWGQSFAGRMDAKIDRTTGVLQINRLHMETNRTEDFIEALAPALRDFLKFNQGHRLTLQSVTSTGGKLDLGMLKNIEHRLQNLECSS